MKRDLFAHAGVRNGDIALATTADAGKGPGSEDRAVLQPPLAKALGVKGVPEAARHRPLPVGHAPRPSGMS